MQVFRYDPMESKIVERSVTPSMIRRQTSTTVIFELGVWFKSRSLARRAGIASAKRQIKEAIKALEVCSRGAS